MPRNAGGRKLSEGMVGEIRRRYAKGETQGALSRGYGVSVGQIGRIVRGESWQNPAVLSQHRPPEMPQEDEQAMLDRLLALQQQVKGAEGG